MTWSGRLPSSETDAPGVSPKPPLLDQLVLNANREASNGTHGPMVRRSAGFCMAWHLHGMNHSLIYQQLDVSSDHILKHY